MPKILKSSTGKKVTNKKPLPEVVEVKEMDFILLLAYMESMLKGSKLRMFNYYTKLGLMNNNTATYLNFPEEDELPKEYEFLKKEYPEFEEICFDIFY